MIDFQGSIVIPAPPETVFSFVANPQNIPRYQTQVVSLNVSSPGPLGRGTQFEEVVAVGPGKMHVRCEIVGWEPHRRVAFVARGPAVHCDAEYSFDPTPEGTRLRVLGQARLQGWRVLLEPLMRGKIRAAVPGELALVRKLLVEPATAVAPPLVAVGA